MSKKRGRPRIHPVVDAEESPLKLSKTEKEKKKALLKVADYHRVYPCDYCNRVFESKTGVRIHMGTCAGKDRFIKEESGGFGSEDEIEDEEEYNNNVEKEVDDVFVEEVQPSNSIEETIDITNEFANTIEISEFEVTDANEQPLIITEFVSVPDSTEQSENCNSAYEEIPQYTELQPMSLSHVEEYVILPPEQEQIIESSEQSEVKNVENNTENRDPLQTQPTSKSYSSIYEIMKRQEANRPRRDIYEFIDDDDPNDEARLAREKLERTCEICDSEFDDPIELLRHRRDKHRRQKVTMSMREIEAYFDYPNREVCPICHRCIKTRGYKSVFIKHLLVHTDGISYECSVCNAKFRRRDHMKAHKKRHII